MEKVVLIIISLFLFFSLFCTILVALESNHKAYLCKQLEGIPIYKTQISSYTDGYSVYNSEYEIYQYCMNQNNEIMELPNENIHD